MELPQSWASSLSGWSCSCHPRCAALPSAAPPEPACLPILASTVVSCAGIFSWKGLAREAQPCSAGILMRRLELPSPDAHMRELLHQEFLYSLRYRYSHDSMPWDLLKYCKAEHVEARKPQLSEPLLDFPLPVPSCTYPSSLCLKNTVLCLQEFGYFYSHASAVPWG